MTEVPHHLTQRGLDRNPIFSSDADREVYLSLIITGAKRFDVDLLGYCLMSNHVHWIATPRNPNSLARAFGDAHGRYAAYANAKLCRSGHFWQNRFFSCALDRAHLWTALRYVERNPVRASMESDATRYRWSSAAAHAGLDQLPAWLTDEPIRSTFSSEQWSIYLKSGSFGDAEMAVRNQTYTGRPVGSPAFVDWAESSLGRKLSALPGGRPPKKAAAAAAGSAQGVYFDVA